jgi:hypothetical protein
LLLVFYPLVFLTHPSSPPFSLHHFMCIDCNYCY